MDAPVENQWDRARIASRHLGAGVMSGFLCGAVIGGIGGRLAMFVLRLTSDPSLSGRLTDDDFEIGAFTSSTMFLVLLCTAAGVVGGVVYLLIRTWIPERRRTLATGVLFGVAGGAAIIKPGGIDFTEVQPHALSIALFIFLPALYGACLSLLTERLLGSERPLSGNKIVAFLPLLGLAILGPIGLAVLALAFAGWMLSGRIPIKEWWASTEVTVAGRVLLVGLVAWSVVMLGIDITEIV